MGKKILETIEKNGDYYSIEVEIPIDMNKIEKGKILFTEEEKNFLEAQIDLFGGLYDLFPLNGILEASEEALKTVEALGWLETDGKKEIKRNSDNRLAGTFIVSPPYEDEKAWVLESYLP